MIGRLAALAVVLAACGPPTGSRPTLVDPPPATPVVSTCLAPGGRGDVQVYFAITRLGTYRLHYYPSIPHPDSAYGPEVVASSGWIIAVANLRPVGLETLVLAGSTLVWVQSGFYPATVAPSNLCGTVVAII